jgi:hypothetical protein
MFGRVELHITKHVPIVKHFPIFSSRANQIEQILCHWMHKLEGYNKKNLNVRSKGATPKTQEENE